MTRKRIAGEKELALKNGAEKESPLGMDRSWERIAAEKESPLESRRL